MITRTIKTVKFSEKKIDDEGFVSEILLEMPKNGFNSYKKKSKGFITVIAEEEKRYGMSDDEFIEHAEVIN